jgi:hypothetical protein
VSCVASAVCQCPSVTALQRADGENRSENGGVSFAALIADFCNNIGTKPTSRDVRRLVRLEDAVEKVLVDIGES